MFSGKKALCIATALLMAVPTMMTGCKPGSTSPSGTKATVTLNMWLVGNIQQGTSRINQAVNDYLKKKGSNIQINYSILGYGDDYENKTTPMFNSGGSDADIVFTANWVNKYRQNAGNGYFEPLTKYLKTDKGKEITKILGQDFLDSSKISGVNYGLPTNKEKAHDWGFLVRSDLVSKYGIDTKSVKKLEDMEPFFAKAKTDNVTPLCIAAFDGPWHFLDWDMVGDDKCPAAIDPATDKVIDPFTDAKSVALYKEMKKYADNGWISKDATTAKGIDDELTTGKYLCGVDSLKPGKDKEESASTQHDYTQIDITPIVMSNRENTGAMLAINHMSKNKDAAFDFIYMLYTDKTLINLIVYGQKDTDYTQNSDNSITLKKSDYNFASGWILGNQFNNLLLNTEDKNKWTNFTDYNAKGAKNKLKSFGFIYDDAKVQTQEAALINIIDANYKQLLAGAVPDVDAAVSAMSKKLDAAGESTMLADMQTQYDAFLKAKK